MDQSQAEDGPYGIWLRCVCSVHLSGVQLIGEHIYQEYWPQLSVSFSPLLRVIHIRKLALFGRGILSLLSKSRASNTLRFDADATFRILQTRVVPEMEAIGGADAEEARSYIVRVALELICIHDMQEMTAWIAATIFRWHSEEPDWKSALEKSIQQLVRDNRFFTTEDQMVMCLLMQIAENDWSATLRILTAILKTLSNDIRKPLVTSFMPSLNNVRLYSTSFGFACLWSHSP